MVRFHQSIEAFNTGQGIKALIRLQVDNSSYNWLGASSQLDVYVKQTAFEYTSTRSIFTMNVGGVVQMKITFLSPVSPDDLLQSSLPYSYMDVEVKSLDGKSHSVQLYTDISAGMSTVIAAHPDHAK